MSSPTRATLDSRERHRFSLRTPGHAVPTRAYQPRHNASTTAGALPPPKKKARNRGPSQPCRLDKPHSISADRDQVLRERREQLDAVLANDSEVLDPHAADAGEVDPRLDRDDVAR